MMTQDQFTLLILAIITLPLWTIFIAVLAFVFCVFFLQCFEILTRPWKAYQHKKQIQKDLEINELILKKIKEKIKKDKKLSTG